MNCDRCPLEDTNDCKKCDPVADMIEKILEEEVRRITGEQKATQEKIE
jgi:hypothetical protein